MADNPTPSTEEVRSWYAGALDEYLVLDRADANQAFDRWLEAERQAAKAEALREFAENYRALVNQEVDRWLETAEHEGKDQ